MGGGTLRVVVAAEEAAGLRTLRAVLDRGHQVMALLTGGGHDAGGRGATVEAAARETGVPVRPAREVREAAFAEWMVAHEVDLLLNVHSLFLISPEVLSAPRIGSFNLHPGPLPELPGLNAPSWALCHGAREHGVTLHWIEPEVDAGPIAWEARFPIEPKDTGLKLSARCVELGLPLIERLLETAASDADAIPAQDQDLSRRQLLGRGPPDGARVPWHLPAAQVAGLVRACDFGPFPSPWGEPSTRIGERELAILKARETGTPAGAPPGTVVHVDGSALVAAADELVAVDRVRTEDGAVHAARVLVAGDRLR